MESKNGVISVINWRNASLLKKGLSANFFKKSLIKNHGSGVINRCDGW
jgi:hypothetical protein